MKILNFGSLNLDYVYSVPHFVRPGETIASASRKIFCGGKGLNQSIAVARAGTKIYHAGKIGNHGQMLLDYLQNAGVDTSFIVKDPSEETGHTIVQVDSQGQNCIILYGGTNQKITSEEIDSVLEHFGVNDLLLLQNEINGIGEIIEKAHHKKMQIALNSSPITDELLACPLQYVTWFLLNEIEGNEITGNSIPEDIASELLRRYPNSSVVLTLGKDGVYYRDALCIVKHGIYRVDRVDTTGAGDTFTGYFLSGIAQGMEIHKNLERASIASSLAVSREGASSSIPLLREVMTANLEPENNFPAM